MRECVLCDRVIHIRRAAAEEVIDLRWRILRPGRPMNSALIPGDADGETVHFGAFEAATGQAVCCLTLLPSEWEGEGAWLLRGMATREGFQRQGLGRAVMLEMEQDLQAHPAGRRVIWCNARKGAVGFYEKLGWVVASEEYHIEDVGPHFKMVRRLDGGD